ncbi:fasciclin domain-containing protein [Haliscomenobacter hydrossis]|uniref:Beta-Ig-H3/fasciclin n=1 Tax=Haliscomenobacter hydrossis (strain ATCC 27775 / DSM 1100 / LMG 10767 / O) TaxID=760192 RepID=F4KSB0_HALH1|nr:fasciclin domain-containing protein [Haliscomenobacter hydrossis]AEE53313.1 beta-Ig-H3/fasciclin [Haliscomenobacter hydrossis DSM 1100]
MKLLNKWRVGAMALLISLFILSCQSNTSNSAEAKVTVAPGAGQSAVADDMSAKDVVKVAVGSPDHKTLVTAVQTANLVDVLSNAGPFTVFAPTDAAFGALPKGTVEDLLKEKNRDKLTDILQYHVAVAVYTEEMLTDGRILSMVNGGSAAISNKNGVIMINDAKVIASVKASNGIVHVIDKVILPK